MANKGRIIDTVVAVLYILALINLAYWVVPVMLFGHGTAPPSITQTHK